MRLIMRLIANGEVKIAHKLSKTTLHSIYDAHMISIKAIQKALDTIRMQESMRKNHVQPAFGDKEIDSFKITDLNDFLYDLYSKQGKSYAYTEGFLKFFYLLFGYACTKVNEPALKFYVIGGYFRVFGKNFCR